MINIHNLKPYCFSQRLLQSDRRIQSCPLDELLEQFPVSGQHEDGNYESPFFFLVSTRLLSYNWCGTPTMSIKSCTSSTMILASDVLWKTAFRTLLGIPLGSGAFLSLIVSIVNSRSSSVKMWESQTFPKLVELSMGRWGRGLLWFSQLFPHPSPW